MQRNYTAEDVKRYRDENSCSVFEAKGYFERKWFLDTIDTAHKNKDFDLLCDVVRELICREKFS
jgi:hypothetical protein